MGDVGGTLNIRSAQNADEDVEIPDWTCRCHLSES